MKWEWGEQEGNLEGQLKNMMIYKPNEENLSRRI
jgi:hypothetical protein